MSDSVIMFDAGWLMQGDAGLNMTKDKVTLTWIQIYSVDNVK